MFEGHLHGGLCNLPLFLSFERETDSGWTGSAGTGIGSSLRYHGSGGFEKTKGNSLRSHRSNMLCL